MKKRSGKVGKVFLSYAHPDHRAAQTLSEILGESGFEVWDPELQVLPGDQWARQVQRGIEQADAIVVLISPNMAAARNVEQEVGYALTSQRLSGRLIPVVIEEARGYPWILDRLPVVRSKNLRQAGREVVRLLQLPAYALQAPQAS